MPTLTIDGKSVTVEPGQSVMNAAEKLGIDIPRFCYHSKLPVAGNCRMCLVEIEKVPKLVTACTTPVTEGMVVFTTTPKVKEGQRAVLEFLLVNHPLDCPICDKAGECMLQDQYFKFSSTPSRMGDVKVEKPKRTDLGPTMVLDDERCVLCTRCVRFLETYADDHSLGIVNRGDHSELRPFPGKQVDSVYSLNTVDLCPVGALTAKDFRFKKRVWFLASTPSVCTFCANQCNTLIQHDDGVIYRIQPRPNEQVNGPWMCDTGRLEYHFVNGPGRVKCCFLRQGDGHVRTSWSEALEVVGKALKTAGGRAAGICSPQMTNEALFQFGRLFAETLGSKTFGVARSDHGQLAGAPADDFLIKADKNPNSRGLAEILPAFAPSANALTQLLESAEGGRLPAVVVFDQNLLARVQDRERWVKALAKVDCLIVASTLENELTALARVVLPLAAWAEEEGTYTRFDGLVQRSWRALEPLAESMDALGLLARVAGTLGKPAAAPTAEAVFKTLAGKVRFYGQLSYGSLGKGGARGAGVANSESRVESRK